MTTISVELLMLLPKDVSSFFNPYHLMCPYGLNP